MDKAGVLRMFRGLGADRVLKAMTHVCKPTYENEGWENCFLTQAFGGKAEFRRMVDANGGLNRPAIAKMAGVDVDAVYATTNAFDEEVGEFLSYARKWLRDRLRRAGRPNPLTLARA